MRHERVAATSSLPAPLPVSRQDGAQASCGSALRRLAIAATFAALIVSCGAGPAEPQNQWDVSRATLGERWPLTAEGGNWICDRPSALVFETEGKRYAVNGIALSVTDHPSVEDIAIPDTENPDLFLAVPLTDFIEHGLRHCEWPS